jgi:hypothetical protein
MLQNLSEEIRECLRHAEECKRLSKTALTAFATSDYLEMEQRWLALARSYEFAERLSSFMGGDVTSLSRCPPLRAPRSRRAARGES